VPRGKGFICEGLFQCVIAHLCKHQVQFNDREKIVTLLMSTTEIGPTDLSGGRDAAHGK
jgi:hypothetical protein